MGIIKSIIKSVMNFFNLARDNRLKKHMNDPNTTKDKLRHYKRKLNSLKNKDDNNSKIKTGLLQKSVKEMEEAIIRAELTKNNKQQDKNAMMTYS